MCINSPWHLIIVLNMKKIHQAIMEECMRIDGQVDQSMDWLRISGLDECVYSTNSTIVEWGIPHFAIMECGINNKYTSLVARLVLTCAQPLL